MYLYEASGRRAPVIAGLGQERTQISQAEYDTQLKESMETAQGINAATNVINQYGPQLTEVLGPLAASLGPMIGSAIKSMGPGVVDMINGLPLPPDVKNFIKGIIGSGTQRTPPPPPPPPVKKGVPTWVWAVGGIGVVTVIAIAASRR
jgi:hypothetical protein